MFSLWRMIRQFAPLAMRTLQDVLAQAHLGPVEPQWGHELALRILGRAGIAQDWQVRQFRSTMTEAFDHASHRDQSVYFRESYLASMLDCWWRQMGKAEPCVTKRARWAEAYDDELDAPSGTRQLPCMCNRYQPGDREAVLSLFEAEQARAFNDGPTTVHPKDPGLVVLRRDGKLVADQMTWGFPVQLRGKSGQLLKPKPVNNARFDKLGGFWKRWAADPAHRCLIPTARFAEAVGAKGGKTETWISVKGEPIFAWAGLWRDSDEWGLSYTGVMTDACLELEEVHDRAPVIITPDKWDNWLSAPLENLAEFDQPKPFERLQVEATAIPWVVR